MGKSWFKVLAGFGTFTFSTNSTTYDVSEARSSLAVSPSEGINVVFKPMPLNMALRSPPRAPNEGLEGNGGGGIGTSTRFSTIFSFTST